MTWVTWVHSGKALKNCNAHRETNWQSTRWEKNSQESTSCAPYRQKPNHAKEPPKNKTESLGIVSQRSFTLVALIRREAKKSNIMFRKQLCVAAKRSWTSKTTKNKCLFCAVILAFLKSIKKGSERSVWPKLPETSQCQGSSAVNIPL